MYISLCSLLHQNHRIFTGKDLQRSPVQALPKGMLLLQLDQVAYGLFENLQANFEKSPRMEDINFLQPTDDDLAYTTWDAVHLHHCRVTLLTQVQAAVHQETQSFSAKLVSHQSVSSLYQCMWVFCPKCCNSYLLLSNLFFLVP